MSDKAGPPLTVRIGIAIACLLLLLTLVLIFVFVYKPEPELSMIKLQQIAEEDMLTLVNASKNTTHKEVEP